jgi:hypothetical protein
MEIRHVSSYQSTYLHNVHIFVCGKFVKRYLKVESENISVIQLPRRYEKGEICLGMQNLFRCFQIVSLSGTDRAIGGG